MRAYEDDTRELMAAIKRVLKSRGVSQQQFADDFDVSLATAKRWLSGQGVAVEMLLQIVDYCDIARVIELSTIFLAKSHINFKVHFT